MRQKSDDTKESAAEYYELSADHYDDRWLMALLETEGRWVNPFGAYQELSRPPGNRSCWLARGLWLP